jgi:hypothetical protein
LKQYVLADQTGWKIALSGEGPVFWIEKLQAEIAKRDADPLRERVEATERGMEAVSTVALLDLIGLPKTTGNGRRIAPIMRSLGFIPIKSRRLMPGGYRDTVTRGWARPVRLGCRKSPKEIVTVKASHSDTSMNKETQRKDACHVQ